MRVFGHPLHAMVVALPLGLLTLVPLWDGLAWLGWLRAGSVVAHYCELAGLVFGALALTTGVAELIALGAGKPEVLRRAAWHGSLALSALSCFVLAFVLRGAATATAGPLVLGVELAGALLFVVTGWFGAELVFAHGVGAVQRD